ncbi:hypothetical protein ACHAWU_006168 [Discostella pseudostelligera]|uniref:Uncharacterized protein n=1 Tax=Discostella pseudostelligera TaxID=259834 RepID=A0ABD3MC67_9STRA
MTIQEQWHRMKGNKESLRFFYTVQHYLMSRPGGVCSSDAVNGARKSAARTDAAPTMANAGSPEIPCNIG